MITYPNHFRQVQHVSDIVGEGCQHPIQQILVTGDEVCRWHSLNTILATVETVSAKHCNTSDAFKVNHPTSFNAKPLVRCMGVRR